MNSDGVHKQAIKRAFAEKYHDERIAIYWGRGDDMIHVIASLNHYTHKIASEQGNALEFAAAKILPVIARGEHDAVESQSIQRSADLGERLRHMRHGQRRKGAKPRGI